MDLGPNDLHGSLLQRGRETQRLRLYFLLPLVVAILITEIVPIVGVYYLGIIYETRQAA